MALIKPELTERDGGIKRGRKRRGKKRRRRIRKQTTQ